MKFLYVYMEVRSERLVCSLENGSKRKKKTVTLYYKGVIVKQDHYLLVGEVFDQSQTSVVNLLNDSVCMVSVYRPVIRRVGFQLADTTLWVTLLHAWFIRYLFMGDLMARFSEHLCLRFNYVYEKIVLKHGFKLRL